MIFEASALFLLSLWFNVTRHVFPSFDKSFLRASSVPGAVPGPGHPAANRQALEEHTV